MVEIKKIDLPSGAVLIYEPSPFAVSLALKEAVAEEMMRLQLNSSTDKAEIIKNLFCISISSQKLKACIWKCFEKCRYNSGAGDLKIDKDTFEPVRARQDYETVCMEVAKEELAPFGKEGFVKLSQHISAMFDSLV
jgi:hypothetical protein